MSDPNASSIEQPRELGRDPAAQARRWKLELKLADSREKDWRSKAKAIYKLYTPDTPAQNSFGILWTNTETMRQAVYNSLPQPDVRRRYSDEDPLGKQVGEVMTRALEFSQDCYDEDKVFQDATLCMLLAGRSVTRVRYKPVLTEGDEAIAWESAECEHVKFDRFRIMCAADNWNEVTAVGFMHRMTRDECIDKFGDKIGHEIKMDGVDNDDVKQSAVADLFKTAEIWEIWDKDEREVIWISNSIDRPALVQDDPAKLKDFFDFPRPIYAIENDQSLVPAPIYTQYEQQARELNRISMRINKLVETLKVRGVYDATLKELDRLSKAADGEMIPAQSVSALTERGGLEKFIWMMPIDTIALVIKELYIQRDQAKQIIYELTGISDIMRSASDPNETFGAQKIKTQWGTQRLQRMQKELQRYIRDIARLKAEIIAEKFQLETLKEMTQVKLPMQKELDLKKQQLMAQAQQAAQQAVAAGQPAPPPPPELSQPMPISWDAVMAALRDDATRNYHIDIETDSTIEATQDADMQALTDAMTACAKILEAFGPAVQQGAMPVDVLKELILVVCRRAKMGTAIEDAMEKITQPPPPKDPEAGKIQAQMQMEQMKAEMSAKIEQGKAALQDQQHQRELQYTAQAEQHKAQLSAQVEQHKQASQAADTARTQDLEAQRATLEAQHQAALEQMRSESAERLAGMANDLALLKIQMDNATKIEVAEIAAGTTLQAAQISAANQGESE